MRKFRRFYYAVLILTVAVLLTVSNQIGAINILLKKYGFDTVVFQSIADTIVPLRSSKDTIPVKRDSIAIKDTLPLPDSTIADSARVPRLDSFTLRLSKDTFSAPIKYSASDSAIGLVKQKTIELYGKAKTDYQTSSLEAPYMKLDQESGLVQAKASRDSLGSIQEYVKMKDGESNYQSDSLLYNIKNQKGYIKGTVTQQGEMFIHSNIAKKIDSNTVYAMGNYFTTCNLDHPHFGFRAKKAKIINKKLAVTGAVHPEFDSVPVPIYLPFGFYPLYQGRHSGLIAPSFETNDMEGLGLSGLGYYHVINDHWDVKFYGDIYSYGTWRLNVNPTYRTIYKYQGQLNFGIQSTQRNFKKDPDYFKSNTYSLSWSHSSDSRARPGVTFSANLNMSSSNYNRNIPNNNQLNFQNVLGSSITYSKQWIDKPYNLSLSFNHSQNNASHLMTINFPTANFTMNTIYPFQKKESTGKKWYDQLGIGYNGSFRNDFNFYDTVAYSKSNDAYSNRRFLKFLMDTARWSANHSIPISLSLPPILGGAVMVSPSISYSQEWIDKLTNYSWGPKTFRYGDSTYTVDTIIAAYEKGFGLNNIKHQASFGLSFNTALYGTMQFKNKRLMAIRHVVRPNFGMNYSPDLSRKFWVPIQIDASGTKALANRLDGLYSRPVSQFTSRRSGGMNFGIDNSLEIKVRPKSKKIKLGNFPKTDSTLNKDSTLSKDSTIERNMALNDSTLENTSESANGLSQTAGGQAGTLGTGEEVKKIKIIDGFGFTSAYNFLADSLRLSPISVYIRTNLFNEGDVIPGITTSGVNISASGIITPYKLNGYGSATKDYAWSGSKFNIGKLTSASISMSTSFQSKPKDPEKAKAREKALNDRLNDPMMQADQQRLMEYMQQNPAEFVDFNTPWSINLSYSLSYVYRGNIQTSSPVSPVTSSVNMTGSFNLSPKWNFSVNGYYDFATKKVQTFSMAISRDLHCWQMAINVTPIGYYRFFNFTISPKAGILQGLKINRNRSFYSGYR